MPQNQKLFDAVAHSLCFPVLLTKIELSSGYRYLWTGEGTLIYDACHYAGVSSASEFAKIPERDEDATVTLMFGLVSKERIVVGAPQVVWTKQISVGAIGDHLTPPCGSSHAT